MYECLKKNNNWKQLSAKDKIYDYCQGGVFNNAASKHSISIFTFCFSPLKWPAVTFHINAWNMYTACYAKAIKKSLRMSFNNNFFLFVILCFFLVRQKIKVSKSHTLNEKLFFYFAAKLSKKSRSVQIYKLRQFHKSILEFNQLFSSLLFYLSRKWTLHAERTRDLLDSRRFVNNDDEHQTITIE